MTAWRSDHAAAASLIAAIRNARQKSDRGTAAAITPYPLDELSVDPEISDRDLDLVLHKQLAEIEGSLHAEGQAMMQFGKEGSVADYLAILTDCMEKATDIKKSDLAGYVFHGKGILDIFEKVIERGPAGQMQSVADRRTAGVSRISRIGQTAAVDAELIHANEALRRALLKGIENRERLGKHRWVVERPCARFAGFGKLCIQFERQVDIHCAFLSLAAAIIGFRFVEDVCWLLSLRTQKFMTVSVLRTS